MLAVHESAVFEDKLTPRLPVKPNEQVSLQPTTTQLPDPEGIRRKLMSSIQEIMVALEKCDSLTDFRARQARCLLEEALDRRLAELRALDAQISRSALSTFAANEPG